MPPPPERKFTNGNKEREKLDGRKESIKGPYCVLDGIEDPFHDMSTPERIFADGLTLAECKDPRWVGVHTGEFTTVGVVTRAK